MLDQPTQLSPRPAPTAAAPGEADAGLQPLLHDLVACLHAPTQVWSGQDGQIRSGAAQGAYHGDVRVLSRAVLTVDGREPEPLTFAARGAAEVVFVGLLRHLGHLGPDPTVRVHRIRTVSPGLVREVVRFRSDAAATVSADVALDVACDLAAIEQVKVGGRSADLSAAPPAPAAPSGPAAREAPAEAMDWSDGDVQVRVRAIGDGAVRVGSGLRWEVTVPPRGELTLEWEVSAQDARAVVRAPRSAASWTEPAVSADDSRLAPLLARSLADLAALRLVTVEHPDEVFIAAGAPWFLTLFGRDSIWAARMLLPLGTGLAASTLRALAAHQGRKLDPDSAEEPGKILHELRRGEFVLRGDQAGHSGSELHLPPVYFGTVDATPLWVCLLNDAWRWGMPAAEVEALLPAAEAALAWMAVHGDADGDGFLEYVDRTGHGLANQGWKDSGDSVQWRDGVLATAPIALCEVQGYAHEAAVSGAALLEAFGRPGADRWREWAAVLAGRFRTRFWVRDPAGPYPAIALDADKRPVDTLTSNIGHLLGTGILDARESALVARRLAAPAMSSGFGLRTMAVGSAGFGEMRYHGGSVWPHDTAIAITGLARAGCSVEAAGLVRALLAAAEAFDFRLPELFGGDAVTAMPQPVPYPAACRPQAWAAASAVALLTAVLGLRPDVPGGILDLHPLTPSPVGAVDVRGLRLGGQSLGMAVDRDGAVVGVEVPAGIRVSQQARPGAPA